MIRVPAGRGAEFVRRREGKNGWGGRKIYDEKSEIDLTNSDYGGTINRNGGLDLHAGGPVRRTVLHTLQSPERGRIQSDGIIRLGIAMAWVRILRSAGVLTERFAVQSVKSAPGCLRCARTFSGLAGFRCGVRKMGGFRR